VSGEVVLVWQGKVRGRQVVFGRVATSVQDILGVLGEAGMSREEFNGMISGVGTSAFLPSTIFVRGSKVGMVISLLRSRA
jgi:hypothetical protein